MIKVCYTTIVNYNYLPFLDELLKTHEKFCNIDLVVYTVNFKYNKHTNNNVKLIEYTDNNLMEYETKSFNKYIKNDYEKHKYTTFLKPKILQNPLNEYDYFLFIDVDGLLTRNSDSFLLECVQKYGNNNIPVSVKYFYDYSNTHDKSIPIFNNDDSFNEKSLNYYHLNKMFGIEYSNIHYLTTYCMYYTKNCLPFFKEVEDICFNEEVSKDYKKYLPLGDETAFNFLYSKYKVTDYISNFLCYDISPFKNIEEVKHNLTNVVDYVSFIHTKRLNNNSFYGDNLSLNTSEYDDIINHLSSHINHKSKIEIYKIEDSKIHFCVGDGYNDIFSIQLISSTNPNLNLSYLINIEDNSCYWIWYNNTTIKDLHLVIYDYNLNIKESIKIY